MSRRTPALPTPAALIAALALTLVACSGSGSSAAPPASQAAPSESAATSPSPAGGGACQPSTDAPAVTVEVGGFAFPDGITAGVDEVIGFHNNDAAGHTATLVDGGCTTPTISNGGTQSLVFSAPGEYPIFCKIHPDMTATVTITG